MKDAMKALRAHAKKPASVAHGPGAKLAKVDPAVIENLVAASRILADQGVVDAFGHVSIRHPKNPERYLLSRARAMLIGGIHGFSAQATPTRATCASMR